MFNTPKLYMQIHSFTSTRSFHPLLEIWLPFLKQQEIQTPRNPLQINYILISAHLKNFTLKELVSHKSIILDWEQDATLYVSIFTQKHNWKSLV